MVLEGRVSSARYFFLYLLVHSLRGRPLSGKDGSWVGHRKPTFAVIQEVLDLDLVRSKVRGAAARQLSAVGKTERRRGRKGSREVFAGTRIPVDLVLGYLRDGAEEEEILGAYPSLRSDDVALARSRLSADK